MTPNIGVMRSAYLGILWESEGERNGGMVQRYEIREHLPDPLNVSAQVLAVFRVVQNHRILLGKEPHCTQKSPTKDLTFGGVCL
jgi:hypothetical protein